MTMTGRCLCGDITYSIEGDPVVSVICHCDDCQRTSGSAFSVNVVVPSAGLTIDGSPRSWTTTSTESRSPRERLFCGECGSTLMTTMADRPELTVVKSGTLDDRSVVDPAVEIWCRSAQDWVARSGERPRFPGDLQRT